MMVANVFVINAKLSPRQFLRAVSMIDYYGYGCKEFMVVPVDNGPAPVRHFFGILNSHDSCGVCVLGVPLPLFLVETPENCVGY